MLVSVVIPVLDEEGNAAPLAAALRDVLGDREFEIIFVDDGSRDGTLDVLRGLAAKDRRIGYLSFSRNFGHQAALRAGMEHARGDCVIMMDGDFQHPPALVPRMLEEYGKGIDIVSTRRNDEAARTPFLKRFTSRLFYAVANALSDIKMSPGAADFRLLSRRAVDVLLSMPESGLFLRGAVPWTGLSRVEIDYVPEPRRSGVTKYSYRKMISLAVEGMTSYGSKPLGMALRAGMVVTAAAFAAALCATIFAIAKPGSVTGWVVVLVCLLATSGIQLLSLGVIGEYLGKALAEAKRRPLYVLKESSIAAGRAEGGDT